MKKISQKKYKYSEVKKEAITVEQSSKPLYKHSIMTAGLAVAGFVYSQIYS